MSYYDDLGIEVDASSKSIKRAYFEKIREHPPDLDALGYQRIRSAYETLSNPSKRSSYDARQVHGGRVEKLEEEVNDLLRNERWEEAISKLKEIVLLDPSADDARRNMAFVLARKGQHGAAIKVMSQLVDRHPLNDAYRMNLGQLWMLQAVPSSDCFVFSFNNAHDCFDEVVRQQPQHGEALLWKAQVFLRQGYLEEARDAAEASVSADGVEDVGDLEALLFLCQLAMMSEDQMLLSGYLLRLKNVTIGLEESAQYVARRVNGLACAFESVGRFEEAVILFDGASELDPVGSLVFANNRTLDA